MLAVQRSVRQKVVAGAAVVVLLGGATFAAVSATGQDDGHASKHAHHSARRLRTHDLAAAASYLGISPASLASELRTGKSLAQIAAARGSDKTASGLLAALVVARQQRSARAAAGAGSHDASPASSKRRAERLQKRVERLLARKFVRGSSS